MSLETPHRPQLCYTRVDDLHACASETETLARALLLARQLEELLEETRSPSSMPRLSTAGGNPSAVDLDAAQPRAHSTRMARAMAASLVDELEVLVRPVRQSGVA
jgi:hypothetical protein